MRPGASTGVGRPAIGREAKGGRYRGSQGRANGYVPAALSCEPIYLRPEEFHDPPPPFRSGEAGRVWLSAQGRVETDVQVAISANSTHALFGHGVVEALNRLALEGRVGQGTDVLVPHALLDEAQQLFYDADRKTYGGVWEFAVEADTPCEYRVRIDNREYQRTLSRLTFLLGSAGRAGEAVRLRL